MLMSHHTRVARIAAALQVRSARRSDGGFVSLDKAAASHFVPNPHDPRHQDDKLDVRDLDEILEIDVAGRTCTAEPGVTFSDLVRATLPHGLAPLLVPELETITIGGAVSGCAVESSSFKHGGFHDGCLEYEIVTSFGEVLRCAPDENPEIFEMIHGSYGTLGIITKLKFRLAPAKPYVRIEYLVYDTFAEFNRELSRRCAAGDVDFVDGIAHSADKFVLCLGRFVDAVSGPTSSYRWLDIYFRSTLTRAEDYLTTYDYFFRYDTDCHWTTQTLPGMRTRLGRLLLGKLFLGSTNLLNWSRRLRPIFKYQKHLPVVIDLFIPKRRFGEFYAWYEQAVGYYPVWIVPYRMPSPYRWIAEAHGGPRGDATEYVDFAVYGLRNDRPGVNYSKLLEERTRECGGIKTLISENHYDEATFWTIYNRDAYDRVKRRTDPRNLFRGLYEKFHFARSAATTSGRVPGTPRAARGTTASMG
jgi:FAD/FMN-containing dehydrogenase